MTGKRIKCLSCGHEGEMEAPGLTDSPSSPLCRFRHLGHNPLSGHIHYQCPACKVVLLVDPLTMFGEGKISPLSSGLPRRKAGLPAGRLFHLECLLRKLHRQQRTGYC